MGKKRQNAVPLQGSKFGEVLQDLARRPTAPYGPAPHVTAPRSVYFTQGVRGRLVARTLVGYPNVGRYVLRCIEADTTKNGCEHQNALRSSKRRAKITC